MDAMRVLVEPQEQSLANDAKGDSRAAMARNLAQSIKTMVGVSVDVQLGEPGSVARSQGKAVRLVDKRN